MGISSITLSSFKIKPKLFFIIRIESRDPEPLFNYATIGLGSQRIFHDALSVSSPLFSLIICFTTAHFKILSSLFDTLCFVFLGFPFFFLYFSFPSSPNHGRYLLLPSSLKKGSSCSLLLLSACCDGWDFLSNTARSLPTAQCLEATIVENWCYINKI